MRNMRFIEIVGKKIGLREGNYILEKFLAVVYFEGPVATKELARKLYLPVSLTTAIKKEFIKLAILEQRGGVQMTEAGTCYFLEECGYDGIDGRLFHKLMNDKAAQKCLVNDLCGEYRDIFDARPSIDTTIDQAKCTAETSFKRAMLCLASYSLIGKHILCVGDDDYVSVAMALLLKRLFPHKERPPAHICIFEMDGRYIAEINRIAGRHHLPIDCVKIDLRNPLPLAYLNRFDCFFTDPPYTTDGLSLFLSRGISALKNEKGLRIFLSYGQKPVGETGDIQNCILSHGLVITEIHKSFNEYEGASLLGNVSQLMVLESTDAMRPLVPYDGSCQKAVYTRETKRPDSRYQCKKCKKIITLNGSGKIKTIEELKRQGCPHCGGLQFLLRRKPSPEPIGRRQHMKSLGEHILADFYECDASILRDCGAVRSIIHEAVVRANGTVAFEEFRELGPYGVSGAVIMDESHLTLRTWPGHRYAAIDLFVCGGTAIRDVFDYLKSGLQCGNARLNNIPRGALMPDGGIDAGHSESTLK